jgi:hypothetical protein
MGEVMEIVLWQLLVGQGRVALGIFLVSNLLTTGSIVLVMMLQDKVLDM